MTLALTRWPYLTRAARLYCQRGPVHEPPGRRLYFKYISTDGYSLSLLIQLDCLSDRADNEPLLVGKWRSAFLALHERPRECQIRDLQSR